MREQLATGHQAGSLRRAAIGTYLSRNSWAHRRLRQQDYVKYRQAYRWHLRGWLPTPAQGRWLDLGCGQGGLLSLARELGFLEVIGVDRSAEMVAAARELGFAVVEGAAELFLAKEPDASFAVITAFDLVEHLERDVAFGLLQDIRRVLVPGGVCILKLPNLESPWGAGIMGGDVTHEVGYAPAGIAQLAQLAGFERCSFREVGPSPTSIVSLCRACCWTVVKGLYAVVNAVETGSPGSGIHTRVMLAKLGV